MNLIKNLRYRKVKISFIRVCIIFLFFKEGEYKLSKDMSFVGEFKHSYTKYKLNIKVYHQILNNENKNYEFKTLKELESTALSALSLKVLKLIKL